jgi:hypothetical protein
MVDRTPCLGPAAAAGLSDSRIHARQKPFQTQPDGASMSTHDHTEGAAAEGTADRADHPKGKGAAGPVILFFFIGLLASLALGWGIFPKLLYSQKPQPIDFSHAMHNEIVDEGCQSCHFFREDGTFSGSPKLDQCIDCHEEVMGVSENEARFVEQYVEKGREVPWLVYARQPDCVFFSHAAHVIKAKMECTTCHGHIGTSDHLRDYEANRITGYSRDIWGKSIAGLKKNTWDRMKMDDCSECHMQNKKMASSVQTHKEACFVCHK